jgi:hypothetical protein
MTDRFVRLAADYAELVAENQQLREERDDLRAELDRIKSDNRRRKSEQRSRDRSRDKHEMSRDILAETREDPLESRDDRVTSRADFFLGPSVLPNQPSKETNLSNLTSSSLTPLPWSGTELAGTAFAGNRASMDLTTIATGHPATPLEPAPPDWSITPEADDLTSGVLAAKQASLSIELVRRVKREVTQLLRTTAHSQVTQGLCDWYGGDENLHPGNIKYWVAKAGRGAALSSKEQRLQNIQAMKSNNRKDVAQ